MFQLLDVHYIFFGLVAFISLTKVNSLFKSQDTEQDVRKNANENSKFKRFQQNIVLVWLTMMMADWMQGPYVYELYSFYGFDKATIGHLFVVGFGTSGVMGVLIGVFADKFGRKKTCIIYGITYALSCATKHTSDLSTLYVGRVLGGIATSILFSCFEAWMVTHHKGQGFDMKLLGETFGWVWGWNGPVAVIAGVITNVAVSYYGPVAAFDCSAIVLIIGTLIVCFTWPENYGNDAPNSFALGESFRTFRDDPRVLVLGFVQSCFEGGMYLFVFMWTPALSSVTETKLNHGWLFACFMLSCMIGSEFFNRVNSYVSTEKLAGFTFILSSIVFFFIAVAEDYYTRIGLFLAFEFCVGIYWPVISLLRSKYIPDSIRSTVMNLFRVPLNGIVLFALINIDNYSVKQIFLRCSLLHGTALLLTLYLIKPRKKNKPEVPPEEVEMFDKK